jgi:hypothetical protein
MSNDFAGDTFNEVRDGSRLFRQLQAVYDAMADGNWYTYTMIRNKIGIPASIPSISARVRDLRKERFGGHMVERRYVNHGLWEYRIVCGPYHGHMVGSYLHR